MRRTTRSRAGSPVGIGGSDPLPMTKALTGIPAVRLIRLLLGV